MQWAYYTSAYPGRLSPRYPHASGWPSAKFYGSNHKLVGIVSEYSVNVLAGVISLENELKLNSLPAIRDWGCKRVTLHSPYLGVNQPAKLTVVWRRMKLAIAF